LGERLVCNQ